MAKKHLPNPFKVRTREHQIASESVAHVETVIVQSGHTVERVESDYGYDLLMNTFTRKGAIEPGTIYLQLKATDSPKATAQGITFRIDAKDYRLWTVEPMPVFLIVYDAQRRIAYWLYVQNYFESIPGRKPKRGAKSVRVEVPIGNVVDATFVRYAQSRKADILKQLSGKIVHNG